MADPIASNALLSDLQLCHKCKTSHPPVFYLDVDARTVANCIIGRFAKCISSEACGSGILREDEKAAVIEDMKDKLRTWDEALRAKLNIRREHVTGYEIVEASIEQHPRLAPKVATPKTTANSPNEPIEEDSPDIPLSQRKTQPTKIPQLRPAQTQPRKATNGNKAPRKRSWSSASYNESPLNRRARKSDLTADDVLTLTYSPISALSPPGPDHTFPRNVLPRAQIDSANTSQALPSSRTSLSDGMADGEPRTKIPASSRMPSDDIEQACSNDEPQEPAGANDAGMEDAGDDDETEDWLEAAADVFEALRRAKIVLPPTRYEMLKDDVGCGRIKTLSAQTKKMIENTVESYLALEKATR